MLRHITMLMGVCALMGLWAPDATALVYNVMSPTYGATGNGTTDDTTAIQNAINAAVAAGGGEVYIPAGTYKLSLTLNIGGSVTIRGEGQRTTNLLWRGLANFASGLSFASSTSPLHSTLTVRSLSLLRDDGVGGMALAAYWPHLGSPSPITHNTGGGVTALIEDIHIGSTEWPNSTKFWDYGIVLWNAVGAKIATFNIQGPGGGVTGIYIGANPSGTTTARSVGVAIHDGTVTNYYRGVFVYDSSEAINVQQLVIKGAVRGIELLNAGRGTSVANNQIWAQVWGIRNYNSLGDIAITNNRIKQEADTGSFVGIEVNNESVTSARCRVIGNYIFSPVWYTSLDTGILVANNVHDTIISGNTTHYMTNGIALANSPVTRTLVHGNLNRNSGTAISSAAATNTLLANNW